MQLAASMFSGLGGMLTNAFLILLTVVFILLEASGFPTKLSAIFSNAEGMFADLDRITNSVKYYLAIKTLTSLVTGVCIAIWLAVQGVDFPILWGLLAFLFNFVPSIGSIIAAIPAVLLAFIQLGIGSALFTVLGYGIVNVVIGSVIEPRVMGRGVGLSALVVFISLVFWGWVLGPIGMLLSVPLSIILKIVLENNEDTRWIAILLGSEKSAEAALPPHSKASSIK
jgi:predicted PurR-regulated permease PerM